jgi:hypothetical protein
MDKAQTLLHWSGEYSKEGHPDVAALLARAAALILSREPRRVVTLDDHRPDPAPVQRLPTVRPEFKMKPRHIKALEVVREFPGCTIRDVSDMIGVERAHAGFTLNELVTAGLVTRENGVPDGTTKPAIRWFLVQDKAKEGVK